MQQRHRTDGDENGLEEIALTQTRLQNVVNVNSTRVLSAPVRWTMDSKGSARASTSGSSSRYNSSYEGVAAATTRTASPTSLSWRKGKERVAVYGDRWGEDTKMAVVGILILLCFRFIPQRSSSNDLSTSFSLLADTGSASASASGSGSGSAPGSGHGSPKRRIHRGPDCDAQKGVLAARDPLTDRLMYIWT
jgi:hypothetical protein